jgi:hypothetical protein
MNLPALFRTVPTLARREQSTFARARPTHPALAAYATTDAVLDALSLGSPLPLGERQELVRALIALHRSERHALWSTLLLHAFRPMLLSLRARDRGSRDERDGRILLAFLQALARTPVAGQPVFLALQRATARGVFQRVRAERVHAEEVPLAACEGLGAEARAGDGVFAKVLAREVAMRIVAAGGASGVERSASILM